MPKPTQVLLRDPSDLSISKKSKKFPDLIDGNRKAAPQTFLNGEIHDWYRIILGYSDHLVSTLLDELKIESDHIVLDPFCGTGTTLIECMKRGIKSIGIDANPSSCFAAKVKTNWCLDGNELNRVALKVIEEYPDKFRNHWALRLDRTFSYLKDAGMIERKWISQLPLMKCLAIKAAIQAVDAMQEYKNALMLALISEVVRGASNVRFGPELYCGDIKTNHNVLNGFKSRIDTMILDLEKARKLTSKKASVFYGDSRKFESIESLKKFKKIDAIICSPPYPTEHDYTRNARLELAFLESVTDRDTLRTIKKAMIRSHTKGIYKNDGDAKQVTNYKRIQTLAEIIERKSRYKTDGFSKLYSQVLQEYFGGMKKHFMSVSPYLVSNARCAYIVGDQSSYLKVHIPTAEILASIAQKTGYKVLGIKHWRTRWSSSQSKKINENILLLQKK